jgi:hypothetical protein
MGIGFVYWEIKAWRKVDGHCHLRKLDAMGTDLAAPNPFHMRVRVEYGKLLCNNELTHYDQSGSLSQGPFGWFFHCVGDFLHTGSCCLGFVYPHFYFSIVRSISIESAAKF